VIRKRSSRGWMLNGSFAYSSTIAHYDSPASYEDPTNISQQNEAQYAPTTGIGNGGGSNLAGIPINAKWIVRANGSYRLPRYGVNIAATTDLRQGYPFPQAINIASRPNRAPAVAVLLDPLGDVRLSSFKSMDLRLDRTFTVARVKWLPSLDVFNLFNANTVLGRRANQNAANANQVFGILAPRTVRVGVMVTF
jgi:hypothetical protein